MSKKSELFNAPVTYGSVRRTASSVSVGITIDRAVLNPVAADDLLCAKRLTCRLAAGGGEPDQAMLFEDLEDQIETICEAKGYSVKPARITTTLNILPDDVELDTLGHFAGKAGRMIVEGIEAIEEAEADPDEDEDGDPDDEAEDPNAEEDPIDPDAWRRMGVSHLVLKAPTSKALVAGGVKTLGKLSDRMAKEGVWWNRGLPRIGDVGKAEVENAFTEFWAAHPEFCEPKPQEASE